jgi:hypothetical protein
MKKRFIFFSLIFLLPSLALWGCYPWYMVPRAERSLVTPSNVYPQPGKIEADFLADQHDCHLWAFNQAGGQPAIDAINDFQIGNTAVGAFGGAFFGGLLGLAVRRPLAGAAVGAMIGGASGAGGSSYDAARAWSEFQNRYGFNYSRCMQSRGNIIAGPMPYR